MQCAVLDGDAIDALVSTTSSFYLEISVRDVLNRVQRVCNFSLLRIDQKRQEERLSGL
jgi:hypothetical protein